MPGTSEAVAIPPLATPPSGARRRRWLEVTGIVLVALGLPVALLIWWWASSAANPHGWAEWFATIVVTGLASAPLCLGLLLAHLGHAGIWRRFLSGAGRRAAASARPAAIRAVLRTSLGRALALFVAAVPLMYVAERAARESSIFVAFLALCGFSVADPLLILRGRSWWAGAGLSLAAWILFFVALIAAGDTIHPFGEGGMIFLLPMMGYPVMLAVSGVVRLFLPRREASGA